MHTSSSHISRRGRLASITAGAGVALVLTFGAAAAPAGAAPAPVAPTAKSVAQADPAPARALTVDPQAAVALAGQQGMTVAAATERLARERALDVRADRIETSLGGRSGGAYLDADGKLVVTTLDRAANALVTRNGASAKVVDDSSARLAGIKDRLDRHASSAGAGAVQGWHVDVATNSVVLTVTEGASDPKTLALERLATSFGDSVRIERRPAAAAPKPAEVLAGGFQFVPPNGGACSVGFNTLDSLNRNVVLTAGHCVKAAGWTSRNGYRIGTTRTANFPVDDFGTFWNSYPSYWQPSPSVYKYNGTYARLAGLWTNPTVGSTICKSGRTTGYTCGRITALNQSVAYPQGVVGGLVRHSACVEGGDSGGANISAGNYALGVTSGASMIGGKCLSKYGQANVSWYQPIGEALSRNGLRLRL
jgi:streptogrisin C